MIARIFPWWLLKLNFNNFCIQNSMLRSLTQTYALNMNAPQKLYVIGRKLLSSSKKTSGKNSSAALRSKNWDLYHFEMPFVEGMLVLT